jgi:hypothetical protein
MPGTTEVRHAQRPATAGPEPIGPPCVLFAPPGAARRSLAPVHQAYLLQARQMQARSFAVHIPLVCFGIAFPAMLMFAEWRYLRTGDPLHRTLARRMRAGRRRSASRL